MSIVYTQPQIWAVDPLTPNEQYWATQGVVVGEKWQNERRMVPINLRNDPEGNIRGIANAMPGMRRIRMPFNQNFFGTAEYPGMHPHMARFLREAVKLGFRFLWVQMDGPSQEGGSGGVWDELYKVYPNAWPNLDSLEAWQTWQAPNGPMSNRHIENFRQLFEWIEQNTPDMIIDGFEAINEPVSYSRVGSKYGSAAAVTSMENYVHHCLRIYEYVNARYPGKDFYIDGWKYAADFTPLRDLKLPAFGNKTAIEVFRERIPSGRGPGAQLVWSAHLYIDWFGPITSYNGFYNSFDSRYGYLLQDRLVITETSLGGSGSDDYRFNEDVDFNRWFFSRASDWFRQRGVGIGWFTSHNYGDGKLFTIFANGEIYLPSKSNLGNFYQMAVNSDRVDRLIYQPVSGHRPVTRILAERGIENQAFDANAGVKDTTKYYSLGFGGLGTCVLTGADNTVNFLYGGPGKTVLYGGNHNDYLYLGTGGGVARAGIGPQATITTNGGNNLIYTGPGQNLVTCIHGKSTIVIDGESPVTRIYGFDPEKGDRMSFKGVFPSGAALRGASAIVGGDTEISLPSGGKVIFMKGANLLELIRYYTLDFTEGWYASGWSEPADYDDAEFAAPMAEIPPLNIPGVTQPPNPGGGTGGKAGGVDRTGKAVFIRDSRGRPLSVG